MDSPPAMDSVTNNNHNHTYVQADDADWWQGATEEDTASFAGGILSSAFLPPPPRPAFLQISSCDLCGWAWQEPERDDGDLMLILDGASEDAPHDLGLVLALTIVSIVSAVIGAIVMVSVIQCRNRLKNIRTRGVCSLCRTVIDNTAEGQGTNIGSTEAQTEDGNKGYPYSRASAVSFLSQQQSPTTRPVASSGHGMWAWLTARRGTLHRTENSTYSERHHHCTPENHYTLSSTGRVPPAPASSVHSIVEEALYAELDEDPDNGSKAAPSEDPSYQNMGYQGSEIEVDEQCRLSSPPLSSSSAYYSDLSTHSAKIMSNGWEATYEVVDQNPVEDGCNAINSLLVNQGDASVCLGEDVRGQPSSLPLAKTVPSDYV